MNTRIQFKLFDHKRGSFLNADDVGWTFKNIVNERYEDIEIVHPTGLWGKSWSNVLEDYREELLYEGDIIDATTHTQDGDVIDAMVEWHDKCCLFQARYKGENGKDRTIWLNGLDNIVITGNVYEK